jgi:hypothetical protein
MNYNVLLYLGRRIEPKNLVVPISYHLVQFVCKGYFAQKMAGQFKLPPTAIMHLLPVKLTRTDENTTISVYVPLKMDVFCARNEVIKTSVLIKTATVNEHINIS